MLVFVAETCQLAVKDFFRKMEPQTKQKRNKSKKQKQETTQKQTWTVPTIQGDLKITTPLGGGGGGGGVNFRQTS